MSKETPQEARKRAVAWQRYILVVPIIALLSILFGGQRGEKEQGLGTRKLYHGSVTGTRSPQQNTNTGEEYVVDKYLHLLERALTGSLYDDRPLQVPNATEEDFRIDELRMRGNDWPGETGHTMVGHLRLKNIKETLLDVLSSGIEGDFAEFGVWRGGSCIYAAGLFEIMGVKNRQVHVFDAFGKLDSNTGGYGSSDDYLAVSKLQVRYNFWKYGLLHDNMVKFYRGLFQDTAPEFKKELQKQKRKLSVLRIDGNFYDSYFSVLENLYDSVSEHGYVIFDDIRSHPDVQRAWKDFQESRGMEIPLINIDDHSAYFQKPQHM